MDGWHPSVACAKGEKIFTATPEMSNAELVSLSFLKNCTRMRTRCSKQVGLRTCRLHNCHERQLKYPQLYSECKRVLCKKSGQGCSCRQATRHAPCASRLKCAFSLRHPSPCLCSLGPFGGYGCVDWLKKHSNPAAEHILSESLNTLTLPNH